MVSSILILCGYFTAWAGVHSLLASLRVKEWARRVFGAGIDRWYRLVYVLFASVSFVPLPLLGLVLPDRTLYIVPAPWRWLMVAGQVAGVAGVAIATRQTGLWRFVGLSQAFSGQEEEGPLLTSGLYCYVRHPGYFFAMVIIWLAPAMTVNLLVLFVLFTIYFYLGSIHEERRLVAEFGEVYEEYRRRVPRFIPCPWRCYGRGGGVEPD